MTSIVGSGLQKGRVDASAVASAKEAMPASIPVGENGTPLFTCMSCAVAFTGPPEQRDHYRSELHRYNMKRRVANLPPVKANVFNAKIQEHAAAAQAQYEAADQVAGKCQPCGKSFSSENAYRDHLSSKKHHQTVAKKNAGSKDTQSAPFAQRFPNDPPSVIRIPPPSAQAPEKEQAMQEDEPDTQPANSALPQPTGPVHENIQKAFLFVPEDASEDDVQKALKERLATATRIDATKACMFCRKDFSAEESSHPSQDEKERAFTALLSHMTNAHSFFIPEQTYLMDKPGLLQYLADKIFISHMCIWCNTRSKVFSSTDAVQRHMHTKGHCRIAYASETDQLELSDFYDFSKSYPDAELHERKKAEREARKAAKAARSKGLASTAEKGEWQVVGAEGEAGEGEWEDDDVDMEDVSDSDSNGSDDSDLSDSDESDLSEAEGGVRLGDTEYELVLPSGTRVGHRTMKRYYNQRGLVGENGQQGSGLARKLLPAPRGRNQAPAPDDGANGQLTLSGRGGHHMVVRNRGEARNAKKLETTYADNRRAQRFNLAVGIHHNQQKHFRAQYLQ